MCYDIKTSLETQLQRAKLNNDSQKIVELTEKLAPFTDLPLYHSSGFKHPQILIYTDESPNVPIVSTWGLVPHWVKDQEQKKKLWNNTLNARGETIFEKPSFRDSAKDKRCLIYIDGFYEHHHYNNNTYPFFIYRKDLKPIALAGLWSEWRDIETGELLYTFAIVTTTANSLMGKIHNNPKLKEPRMPVILPEELEDNWLNPINDELDKKAIQELIREYPEEELDAYTVDRLRGKEYKGNTKNISNKLEYKDLVF
ncbi:SOS response-associated peptidase [Aquimarina algiphila]|uniref:Abasic site processing protein n=1 Tax=Aquimarina algiphila TaxID=2047982 RepID=A0A554VJ60_9FLAO|nr:SOS response-associated peptidase [Aquimarina algiphila]TSE07931.1 SOS response-associated peptidase [Aquimarina algiphila]